MTQVPLKRGGGQMQWQQFVFGVEASYTARDLKKSIVSPYFPADDVLTGRVEHLLMVVGRVGYAFDRVMVYAKGGYAGADVGFKARHNTALVTYQRKLWQHGYSVGGGVEYAWTNNIILGVDYTHVKLDGVNSTGPNVFDNGALGNNPESYRTDAKIDMMTARLSYKFGGAMAGRY